MKMLRYSGLAVLVVCIAAFASGCGGGGGGGTAADDDMDMDVVMCTAPQVEMNGQCVDPPPTDEQRIEAAQDTLAGIVAEAQTRVQAARSDARDVEGHADATDAQKTSAGNLDDDVQDALTDIVVASAAANVATTGAQAETALSEARTALNELISVQQSVANILSAVNAIANLRQQQEQDERLATNGSGLIEHVRDNKIVYDAILTAMTADDADPLTIGTTDNSNMAEYPKDMGTGADRVTGERGVMVNTLTSSSTTPKLSGTGRLPHGFDLKNADNTLFVNAYTDITKTRVVRTRVALADDPNMDGDQRYENRDVADTDYLLAGIWLQSNAIEAFAYGSQSLTGTLPDQCGVTESAGATTDTLTRACVEPAGFSNISNFVADGKDVSATYRGNANGAYLAGGAMSYFEADVTLTAEFLNPTDGADADNNGSIEGKVTNIVAGGKSIAGSIELQKHDFDGNAIGAAFGGEAVGVVAGKSYSGDWKGQFFGQRFRRTTKTETIEANTPQRTTTTTYSPEAPGSVAGTFYATQQSAPAGSAAFIGAFGAHR